MYVLYVSVYVFLCTHICMHVCVCTHIVCMEKLNYLGQGYPADNERISFSQTKSLLSLSSPWLSTYSYVDYPNIIFLFCELLLSISKFPVIIFLHTNS